MAANERDLRRRPAVELCIAHSESERRLGRNHLRHAAGDACNAVVSYNLRGVLAWSVAVLRLLPKALTGGEPLRKSNVFAQ
jgi:hypothetical protein